MSVIGRLRSDPARPHGRCDAGEHGGVLLLVATLLPVLLSFTGLAVDVRNGYVVRSMLQHSLDDGVLSAQRWSAQADDTPGASGGVEQSAVAEALVVARQELASEGLSRATVTTATPSDGQLTMTAEAPVPTFFLGALGIRSWTVVARADIALWSGQTIAPIAGAQVGSETSGSAPTFFTGSGAGGTGSAHALPPASPVGGGDSGNGLAASSPAGPSTQSGASVGAFGTVDASAACNCDAIVAGDAVSAAAALDRMGVTPADPGPYAGDFTAGLGLGEMQSPQQASEPGASAASDGNPGDGGGDSSGASSDNGSGDGGAW